MNELLFWSDIPYLHSAIMFGCLAALVALIFVAGGMTRLGRRIDGIDYLFLLTGSLLVIAGRWPSVFHFVSFSIDEDQFIAAARKLFYDPVFFRSVEAGSSGPANIYPLVLPALFGAEISLVSARLVAIGAICLTFVFLYLALRLVAPIALSRAAAGCFAAFFAFANFWDFSHYTSEIIPNLLLSIAAFGVVALTTRATLNSNTCFAIAFLSGMAASLLPLAKLQATYFGILIGGALILVVVFCRYDLSIRSRAICIFGAIFGALAVPALFVGWISYAGQLDYFIKSYFGNALEYVAAGHQIAPHVLIWRSIRGSADFSVFGGGWLLTLAVCGVHWLLAARRCTVQQLVLVAFAVLLLLVAGHTIASPKRDWPHYSLFAVYPMALLIGILAGSIPPSESGELRRGRLTVIAITAVIVAFCVLPIATYRLMNPNPWVGHARVWTDIIKKPHSKVGKAIVAAASNEVGTLVVWGYNPNYYTETGMIQGTRLSISTPQFNNNSLQGFFRETYLQDLLLNRPLIFVDAAVEGQFPAMDDGARFRHELVPGVGRFVGENYRLIDTVDGVRIFKRND